MSPATHRLKKLAQDVGDATSHAPPSSLEEVRKVIAEFEQLVTKSTLSDPWNRHLMINRLSSDWQIFWVREGLPAEMVTLIAKDLGWDLVTLLKKTGISRSTVNRKEQRKKPLSSQESERIIGISKLIDTVRSMVSGSEEAENFDAEKWVGNWLKVPMPALGNKAPADYMDTSIGQSRVLNLLKQIQSGSYA